MRFQNKSERPLLADLTNLQQFCFVLETDVANNSLS